MRIKDFEDMQRNLVQMKNNLEDIQRAEMVQPKKKSKGRRVANKKVNRVAREEQIIVMVTIAIVAFTCIFSTSIFAKTMSENSVENQVVSETQEEIVVQNSEEGQAQSEVILEKNENAIELEEILLENVSVLKSKEYVEEERPIEFEIIYNENSNLPEGEEVVTREGVNGKERVKVIKSYENNVMVSEKILESLVLEEYISQVVDKGTSKFLSNNKAHLGDRMYITKEIALLDYSSDSANEICKILKSLDVTLLELSGEDWCKIEYDGLEGYVPANSLTTSQVTPGIIEANRVQRIKMTLEEGIPLNQSTDLSLEDYKKILSGNSADRNHVIEENAEAFYNADKTYHMNGVFLAAMAIHESGWGMSTIANDKKNLFGYGAYDRSPYESSFSFETYAEGIDLVAKVLVKYYINEEGTPIYGEEVAKGSYYNEPTVAGVNVRYASDGEWHHKIYKYMEYLYGRL